MNNDFMKNEKTKQTKKKIVIIGAGIGGLSAGIYALNAGYDAVIYEKNPVAGGECMGWDRKGYHIDNCIHWLTGTDPKTGLWKVWKTLGAIDEHTKYHDEGKFYTSFLNGKHLSLWNDLEKTRQELIAFAPEDTDAINTFIEHVEYAKSCVIPSEKPLDMMGIRDYIEMGKDMADMPKVIKTFGKINMEDFGNMFKNPLLKIMMSDYLCYNYTAYSFLVSYATMACGNGRIPEGGSLAMTNRIVQRFRDLGGQLYLNAPVERILIKNRTAVGIRLESGEEIYGDEVISAIDAYPLFHKLLNPEYMPKAFRKAYEDQKGYPTFSGFQAAFAIDDDFSQTGTVCFDCEPLKIGSNTVTRMSAKSYAYERSFAPEGRTVLQCNFSQQDADYLFWKNMDEKTYRQTKEELTQEVLKRIVKQFPELEGKIELLDSWTPRTYERYCNAYHGAYMSFITTKDAKQLRIKGELKNLKHFYLAGQWIMCPGGLPIAAVSGKFAIQRILKREGRPFTDFSFEK